MRIRQARTSGVGKLELDQEVEDDADAENVSLRGDLSEICFRRHVSVRSRDDCASRRSRLPFFYRIEVD